MLKVLKLSILAMDGFFVFLAASLFYSKTPYYQLSYHLNFLEHRCGFNREEQKAGEPVHSDDPVQQAHIQQGVFAVDQVCGQVSL